VTNRAPTNHLVRNCAIGGLILAEIYMVFTVAGPRMKDPNIPLDALLTRLAVLAVFFGPFGLAAGTGVGLLINAFRKKH
jgi:hypothetical protein